jgi:hypothetical protein
METDGGYTKSKWHSNNSYVDGDVSDFLFSLDNKAKYTLINNGNAIYGGKYCSVAFGDGHDIYISNGCTTNNDNHSNPSSYNIPSNLAGSFNFTVIYMEVFKVMNKN